MKYLELKPIEIEVPEGKYIQDYTVWNNTPSGCYLVKDGPQTFIAIVSAESRYVNMIHMPDLCIIDTKPGIEEDMIYNHLIAIEHQIRELSDRPVAKDSGGLSGDILIKALAVAQKPELAKDL